MGYLAGIVSSSYSGSSATVRKMLKVMSLSSSPEEPLLFRDNHFVFGNIDQTIETSENKICSITFDGHIYNIEEIKEELLKTGQIIKKETPHAILLSAYQTWGKKLFSRLNGSFILLIYDKNEKKLLLVRDPLGGQRVFWGKFGNTFLFSGQLKGMISSGIVPQNPELAPLASYFFLGYLPQDKTPVQGVNRLPPGYYLEINEKQRLSLNPYRTVQNSTPDNECDSPEKISETLDTLLRSATLSRLPRGQAPGLLFEPSIGSTATAHYVKELSAIPPLGFFADFDRGDNGKLSLPAEKMNIPLYEERFSPEEMLNDLPEIIWHLDEPVSDPGILKIWNLGKRIKSKTSFLFSGLGAEELLSSSLKEPGVFYEPVFLWLLYLSKPFLIRKLLPFFYKIGKRQTLRALRFLQKDFWSLEYFKEQSLFQRSEFRAISPSLSKLMDTDLLLQQSHEYLKLILFKESSPRNFIFFDTETCLSNSVLIRTEHLLKAQGIQLLCPFLDGKVFEYILTLPERRRASYTTPALPVYEQLSRFYSDAYLRFNHRKKTASFPKDRINQKEIREIFSLLSGGVLAESGIISRDRISSDLRKKEISPRKFEQLWAILSLEIWFQLFINRKLDRPPKNLSLKEFLSEYQL